MAVVDSNFWCRLHMSNWFFFKIETKLLHSNRIGFFVSSGLNTSDLATIDL